MQKLIVIVGPTAVGKTSLSLEIAKAVNGEIVSGDSMQIYRELNVGTAKATLDEQAQAPHHLIDIADPEEHYSAAKFVDMAQEAIADIASRGKVPILVGGTGFYVQALLGDRPLSQIDERPDDEFEAYWDDQVQQHGEAGLREALRAVDAVSAERILPGQIRRLKRALLISQQMGIPFSSLQPEPKRQYDAYIIGLNTDRERLYERINRRVDMMLEEGLMAEVARVYDLSEDATARKAIGYKELFGYHEGIMPLEEASEMLKMASRRYAKRQLTWFNNQFTDIHWADLVQKPDTLNVILEQVEEFVSE